MDSAWSSGSATIHPAALALTLAAGILMLVLPRRHVIVPILVVACFIPLHLRIVVAGMDFMMVRILILFGWARLLMRSEYRRLRPNDIDRVFLWWVIAGIVTNTLLWQTGSAFVNRLGFAFNALGMYFLFRVLIGKPDELDHVVKTLLAICVILSMAMFNEHSTGRNLFSYFGGVSPFTYVREGKLRCMGAFGHPILAGTFGASVLPLFMVLWRRGGHGKALALCGIAASTLVTWTSASSGPIVTYAAALVGFCLWSARRYTRQIRWGLGLTLLALHMVMKAPVWFLIGRVDFVGGSTGFHRSMMIDCAISHLSEWWLLGTKTTEFWGHHSFDVTNHFVLVGVEGGLISLILLILMISLCFGGIGRAVRAASGDRTAQLTLWALGAWLLAHVVSFMGVAYWDQTILVWYLTLAVISSMVSDSLRAQRTALACAPAVQGADSRLLAPAVR